MKANKKGGDDKVTYGLKFPENFLAGTTAVGELISNFNHDIFDYIDIDLTRG